jgi:small subunit ribosomal protein S3
MGHKVNPIGFRLGITVPGHQEPVRDWLAKWYAGKGKSYAEQVLADASIRKVIDSQYRDAGIARVDIERSSQDLVVNVHTARPGIVIGRGGQRVEELRKALEETAGTKRVRLNVVEIRQPELDAYLVARNIADQLERRVAYRRAIRQTVQRTTQAGAQGVKVLISGRLGGAEIARREKAMEGRVPLHTLRANIDYGLAEAHTNMGLVGVKVWIYRGEMVPQQRVVPADEGDIGLVEVTVSAADANEAAVAVGKPETTPAAEPAGTVEAPVSDETAEGESDAPTQAN